MEKVRASWIRSHLRDYCYCLFTVFSSLKSTECFLSGHPVFYLPSQLCWFIWQYLHFLVAQFYTHYQDYTYLSMLSKHIVHEIEIWEISPGNVSRVFPSWAYKRTLDKHFLEPPHAIHCFKSLQSCLTLYDRLGCSPPASSARGILQAKILEWVAMPSSRPRDQACVSMPPALTGRLFTTSAAWEVSCPLLNLFKFKIAESGGGCLLLPA